MSMEASSEPATPVFTMCVTPYRSHMTCTHMPADTLPMPHLAMTTGMPASVPSQKRMPARSLSTASCACSIKVATSTSMAPMMPSLTCLFSISLPFGSVLSILLQI